MTSTTDMAGHPDVAEISDLTEGLLPPARTADIRQHLTECELCADVHASLEEIRGLLGTFPGPPGMPADIAGRIDAALAAEALLNATVHETEGAPSLVTASRSLTDADDGTHVSRETSAPPQRPSGRARVSTTGPGRKDRKRTGRRRAAILGSVFAVAALGLGTVLVATLGDGKPSRPEASGPHTTTADTFSETKLGRQVSDLLAKEQNSGQGSSAPQSSVGVQGNPGIMSPKIDRTPSVPPCILNGIGRNDSALATKEGTYKGTHALLVVLPDLSDSTKVNAYIVDATCVTHPSSATAKVLLTRSYTRQQG
ncbi:anti-sigma factor family protein [Streptomyces sp. NPDC101152]|uniref:anti-sigma factor family protein n=1 Tax=Streptomyces sp. NPDC101152 TaxID=3366116 RepID=UPI0038076B1F